MTDGKIAELGHLMTLSETSPLSIMSLFGHKQILKIDFYLVSLKTQKTKGKSAIWYYYMYLEIPDSLGECPR